MPAIKHKHFIILFLLAIAVCAGCYFMGSDKQIDFSADVKPIINKKCIICHGGVRAKLGFSLLFHDQALAKTESGKPAIIPGDPEHSELIRRISVHDPEERMPYKHEPLSKEEIDIFKRWIKQGAKWGDHWAYLPVKETPVPEVEDAWIKNDIDKFIYAKLQHEKLTPSPAADKATILRRVSLDLTGLLPDDKIAKQFLQSTDSAKAYETLVDSLLCSEHFGERWASMWLDLARYADTKGYESDGGRNIWQYRDWVIKAFNNNMPYDEFIKEQIAGDLLPDPTDAQYIATAFHRNSMTNDEGGTNNEEFRTAAVLDRVNTTWEALMSTTFSCVQCHSHPYDPFKHDEYYKFMAYFNNTRDEDVPGDYPLLKNYNDTLQQRVNNVVNWVKQQSSNDDAGEMKLFLKTGQPAIYCESADSLTNAFIGNMNVGLFFKHNAVARLKHVNLDNINRLIYDYSTSKKDGHLTMHLDAPDGPVVTSWLVKPQKNYEKVTIDFPVQQGIHDVYLTYTCPSHKGDEFTLFFDWFAFTKQLPGKGLQGYAAAEKDYNSLLNADVQTTPVMVENPAAMHRTSNVFERGAWRSKGKVVNADVPQSLHYAMPANAPNNRLGLVMWLVNKQNPLVSRTIVNRLWEQLFGTGIVETLEDLGTQGIAPTHKELLDYLSYKFMNGDGWQLKKILKEMVMSATYRQQSKVSEELKQRDLFNKFYARGPRLRLSAEQLRDQDLCISGAISKKMYGPGVMPWQPDGIWLSPYNGSKWKSSKGEDQYRRAIYTYWKRSSPYPSMISYDAAQRNVCAARRIRTNTPLQALTTLNDSAYMDLSRHFANRMKAEAGKEVSKQIAKGYELMLYKPISAARLSIFEKLYQQALSEFKSDADKTCEVTEMSKENNNPQFAALIVVANAMLNLDEVVVKN